MEHVTADQSRRSGVVVRNGQFNASLADRDQTSRAALVRAGRGKQLANPLGGTLTAEFGLTVDTVAGTPRHAAVFVDGAFFVGQAGTAAIDVALFRIELTVFALANSDGRTRAISRTGGIDARDDAADTIARALRTLAAAID
jgi:hypothetical protein